MAERQPISTAPKDGTRVTVYWTDGEGVMNESIARWSAEDKSWWAFTDGSTQKKIEPASWRPSSGGDDEE